MRFRAKPAEIDAIQWTGNNFTDVVIFCGGGGSAVTPPKIDKSIELFNFLESCYVRCPLNHWVIRGVRGEYYPCDPVVMRIKYDKIEE